MTTNKYRVIKYWYPEAQQWRFQVERKLPGAQTWGLVSNGHKLLAEAMVRVDRCKHDDEKADTVVWSDED